ncbi:MAG: hypothetical protein P8X97_03790 [Candidatus Bathyarchaeota archaeon]
MNKSFSNQNRKKLQKIMLKALNDEISILAPELQSILADDMVTVFQNRLLILQKIQLKSNL